MNDNENNIVKYILYVSQRPKIIVAKLRFVKRNTKKRYLRNIIESVDDDQTQSDKKDDSGWNDIRRNKKAHP